VGIWIPARIGRALRTAAAGVPDPGVAMERVRRWAALGALIVVYAAVLGARALGRLVYRERGIVVLVLAVAIPFAALEFRSRPGARTTDAPVTLGPTPAWMTANRPAGDGVNQSAKENASMTAWEKGVEQALRAAGAREQARPQDAAKSEHGVDATAAQTIAAQEGEATRTDLAVAREPAKKQAETLSASNGDKAAAEAKAASGSGVAKDANAAHDAKRANETKGSEQSSDFSPIADGQDRQTVSTDRANEWNRRAEIFGAAKEADDRDVARENAIARHALTYSWATIDRAGHRWVHIRPLYYSQR
jgi:hypothetical protein